MRGWSVEIHPVRSTERTWTRDQTHIEQRIGDSCSCDCLAFGPRIGSTLGQRNPGPKGNGRDP